MTNFEKIKQMDVVAFASATAMGFPCEKCKYYETIDETRCPTSVTCKAAYREWLEEEAKEQNDDEP